MARPRRGERPRRSLLAAVRAAVGDVWSFWGEQRRALQLGAVALLVAATADLGAGLVLSGAERQIVALPGLLLLVPGAIALRGATFGAFGARLGTALAIGTYDPELRPGSWLWRHVEAVALLTVVTSAQAAVLAVLVAGALRQPTVSLADLLVISTVGGVLASVVLLFVTLVLARSSQRRGWSMDDVAAPAITATGDLLTIPALLVATRFAGRGPATAVAATAIGAVAVTCVLLGWFHRVDDIRRLLRESLLVLTGAALVSVLAGAVLESQRTVFLDVPLLLVLFPAFVAMFGSLGGILASRLTSQLHLGVVEPSVWPRRPVWLELSMTFLFALAVYTYLGGASWALGGALGVGGPGLLPLVAVSVLGGLLGTTLLSVVATTAATATYRLGLDPDNHAIPVVTSVMDLLGMLCLVGAVALVQVGAS